jgi:hypothetical protein
MVLPPALRYQLIRLKSLNRPALWGLLVGTGMLAVAGHQYRQHPEWLGTFEPDANHAPGATADTTLSPADQARLAEIDNLSVLLDQMQPTTAGAIETPVAATIQPAETTSLALPDAEPPTPLVVSPGSTTPGPFATYLEQNQFRAGRATPVVEPSVNASVSPGTIPAEAGADSALSPLERALLGQQSVQPAPTAEGNGATASEPDNRPQGEAATTGSATPGETANLNDTTLPPWYVEGTTPGSNQSFIRTTPQMSPPPGTTGYTLPPSLQTAEPAGGAGSAEIPSPPTAAPLDLDFSPTRDTALPSGTGSAAMETLPNPTTPGGYTQPQSGLDPAPFSVPRPPGSHTGGGYIYTFSDPNGPGE